MNRKLVSTALAAAMVCSMGAASATTVSAEEQKTVGILMPTQSSERWINDGANMKKQLEEKGYKVELQYAEDDTAMQVSQLENYVGKGVDCLVIAAIDSGVLVNAEAQAKEAGIPIIAYDRLLMDTDAVSYYATFDNKGVGTVIGNYIKDTKDLDAAREAGESYTIEFFMGSPDDNNALFLYNGIMEVLQEYLDDGTLVCKSGRTSFEDTCILRWSQETAQTMSIYKDTRLLAEKAVTMVDAVLKGEEPEINDTEQYDNGKMVVPTYMCTPVAVDQSNYKEILIDGGYYTEDQLK